MKPEPLCLIVICGVEFVALTTGMIPPWTHGLMRLPKSARAVIVGAAAWWLADHLEVL